MKCKRIFSGKFKKNTINLLSAEFAQKGVKVQAGTKAVKRIIWLFLVLT